MEIEGLDDLNISVPDNTDTEDKVVLGDDGLPVDDSTLEGDKENQNGDAGTEGDGSGETTGDDAGEGDGGEGTGEGSAEEEGDDTKTEDTSNLSGVEQYLSQFNIEGGMIDFQNGDRTHFNELDADKQLDVLTKLHESATQDIEAKYGLDEDEIGLINYMRQQEGTIEEVIDQMANQRAQTYITSQEVKTANIDEMDSDAIYTSFLLKSNPEATAEQIETDLAKAKEMATFDSIVDTLKTGMIKEQDALVAQRTQASADEMNQEIESQRKEVVDAVSKMEEIDGLSINDGIKNDVLDLILDVDDDGDSLFMTEVFSNPKKLFKAAFWYKNGTDIINAREEYWKKEKSAAYKRGQSDTKTGKISFTSNDTKDQNKTTPHYDDSDETVSFDDLHSIS